jgi:hypothetical protein
MTMSQSQVVAAPSRKTLFTVIAGGIVAASIILTTVVLPAEYRIDPLGVGKATGLLQLSRPEQVEIVSASEDSNNSLFRAYTTELRTDTVDIPLAAAGDADGKDQLEWKVRMRTGETLVYSWTADAPAEEFYFDMHGESPPSPEVKVVTYQKGTGIASRGSIVAPFDGIHGWYLQNQAERPVVVRVKLSGFYELPTNAPISQGAPSSASE